MSYNGQSLGTLFYVSMVTDAPGVEEEVGQIIVRGIRGTMGTTERETRTICSEKKDEVQETRTIK